ncbi:MAG: chemotaxis protein CheW [Acidobacteriota bacterium]
MNQPPEHSPPQAEGRPAIPPQGVPEAAPEAPTETWRGIVVSSAGQRFFVPTEALLAIEKDLEIYPFPLGPSWLAGVARWRLGPVSVARLADFAGGSESTPSTGERLLVLSGSGGEPLGVLVGGIEGSRSVPPTPRSPSEVGLDSLPEALVAEAVTSNEEWLPVLSGTNLEKFLNAQAEAS